MQSKLNTFLGHGNKTRWMSAKLDLFTQKSVLRSSLRLALDEVMVDTDRVDLRDQSFIGAVGSLCRVITEHRAFTYIVYAAIAAAPVVTGLRFDENPALSASRYAMCEWLFLGIFTLELILKVMCFETKPVRFLITPSGSSSETKGDFHGTANKTEAFQ